jgi:hypothetical protein
MPVSERRKWKTNRSDDEILKIVLANLAQKKAKVIEATPKRIEATIGDQLLGRLKAGFRDSSGDALPVKLTLNLFRDAHAKETVVDVTIQDNLRFAVKTGIVGTYRNYMQRLLDELARNLRSTPEVVSESDTKPKFCNHCGAQRSPNTVFCAQCGALLEQTK